MCCSPLIFQGDRYVIKYSVKPIEDMRVAKKFTHIGQLKGSKGGKMIKGDPIYSLTANNNGLMVRFSNLESIEGVTQRNELVAYY